MNRRNYSRELEQIIQNIKNEKPKVLLHSCCGPCSSSVLEYLVNSFGVSIFWYNPNLYPQEEYDKRLSTQIELLNKMNLSDKVNIISEPWRNEDYYCTVKGLEKEPEGGKRCAACFRLRLLECAKTAKEKGFDYFCSTLTVSRHKNAVLINSIGEEIAEEVGITWLPSDFKKHDGENRSVELSEKYGIYRQLYCGCEYSLESRLRNEGKKGAAHEWNGDGL